MGKNNDSTFVGLRFYLVHNYWTKRYIDQNTPWDMGSASPPLTAFLQNLSNKNQRILIPGAGNSYEAEWLFQNGFSNVFVMDISEEPLKNLKKRIPNFPEENLLCEDFFQHQKTYDLIVEQTFFCALQPEQRKDYVQKISALLNSGGSLFGVLFDFPLTKEGPPFGGSQEEYRQLFSKNFKIQKMEKCYNSIKPRADKELFFRVIKS